MIPDVIRVWKCAFQNVTPIVCHVSVLTLHTFGANLWLFLWWCLYFKCLSCSNHGEPPSDKPSVTDSLWYLSLQHSAGWKLHPALTWCLQLYWLAPREHFTLCVQFCRCMCVRRVCAQLAVLLSVTLSAVWHGVYIQCVRACACVSVFFCFFYPDYVAVRQIH